MSISVQSLPYIWRNLSGLHLKVMGSFPLFICFESMLSMSRLREGKKLCRSVFNCFDLELCYYFECSKSMWDVISGQILQQLAYNVYIVSIMNTCLFNSNYLNCIYWIFIQLSSYLQHQRIFYSLIPITMSTHFHLGILLAVSTWHWKGWNTFGILTGHCLNKFVVF